LGVGSIVLGLALQNSVGNIISGLFLLFEQPFQLGDWIDARLAGNLIVRGPVVEVNWRATHIHAGDGVQIVPNSMLAAASFTNLSRPEGAHLISVGTVFALSDPSDDVCRLLTRVASTLPQRHADELPRTVPAGGTAYTTSIPLKSPADADAARATFLRWIWFAARRADLHLDGADDDFATSERAEQALRMVASTLRLNQAEQQEMLPHIRITRYGAAETIQVKGEVPQQITFIVSGRVGLTFTGADGSIVPVRTLEEGDFLGQTALTREAVTLAAHALEKTTVLQIQRDHIEGLVQRKPLLLQDIGRKIEEHRQDLRRALASMGY
ncbi:MAG TPA: mechanosensitive ion channel family protein, partial [Mycobacterium sp.]|nr:mechanosensitive ion channel family protein [Mycobacterium sp.]